MKTTISDTDLQEAMNKAIAEELVREVFPDATEELINDVWDRCKGNPWNASVLCQIMKAANEQSSNDQS